MKNKKAIKFTMFTIPFGVFSGFLSAYSSFDSMPPKIQQQIVDIMPKTAYSIVVGLYQGLVFGGLFAYLGYILSQKVNLMKPLKVEKNKIIIAFILGSLCGLLFILDYFSFARFIPQVMELYSRDYVTYSRTFSDIFYGGIIEEVLMRLVLMSLISLVLLKLFKRDKNKENIPTWVFSWANIVSAFLFASGHLIATAVVFGELSLLIVLRAFVLNTSVGIVYGYIYIKHGIQYAMVAHGFTHVVYKGVLLLFIL